MDERDGIATRRSHHGDTARGTARNRTTLNSGWPGPEADEKLDDLIDQLLLQISKSMDTHQLQQTLQFLAPARGLSSMGPAGPPGRRSDQSAEAAL